jgi:hypothetical protein
MEEKKESRTTFSPTLTFIPVKKSMGIKNILKLLQILL